MRFAIFTALLVAAADVLAAGRQPALDARLQGQLKQLFPAAASFGPKGGEPPHYKAYSGAAAPGSTVAGYAFWTTELEPLERGYDGPIKMLVGMDPKGVLTGVIVVEHHEPYGNFSVETPQFAAQFKGKSVRDPFTVGTDIDAISRATISVTSASRAVKLAARKVARQLLTPESVK